jgi:hypothetical protein
MTLLTIVQDAADEIGWDSPTTVVGNSDANQFFRLLNREGEALSKYPWEILVKEATYTLATSDQDYALATDFRYLLPATVWNRDNQRSIIWINSQEWQFFKGWTTVNGLNLRARIRAGQMEYEQTITSSDNGKTIAYEYISKNWTASTLSVAQQKFAVDTDTSVLDEELLTLGLVWRFKKAKGLDWEADFADYNKEVKLAKARDGGSRLISLAKYNFQHLGANTQEGNFSGI